MARKVNPNIYRIAYNGWDSSYFSKKRSECSIYVRTDCEIKNFMTSFFKKNKLYLYNSNLFFLEKSLHISVSYSQFLTLRSFNKSFFQKKLLRQQYKTSLKKKHKINVYVSKSVANTEISIKNVLETHNMKFFSLKLLETVSLFMNRRYDIFLILKKLNHQARFFKTNKILPLRKYKTEIFYKEGVRILFLCGVNRNSAKQLADYVVFHLGKQRRHNRFFKFVKETLSLIKQSKFAVFEGIKIQIKGRINGQSRAGVKILKIGEGIGVSGIHSHIIYENTVAYGSNGTFGVKVWVQKSNNNF